MQRHSAGGMGRCSRDLNSTRSAPGLLRWFAERSAQRGNDAGAIKPHYRAVHGHNG